MFKTAATHITLILVLFIHAPVIYAAGAVSSIIDLGLDGTARLSNVLCVNGKRGVIQSYSKDYQSHKKGDICYQNKTGSLVCRQWTLYEAATNLCQEQ